MASNYQNIPKIKQFSALIPRNRVGEMEDQQEVVGASTTCPRYFRVLYTKYAPTKKRKNKSFLDGYMVFGGTAKGKGSKNVVLLDEESKEKVSIEQSKVPMVSNILKQRDNGDEGGDESFRLGSWEVEVDVEIEEKEFLSGQAFLAGGSGGVMEPPKYSYPSKKTTGFLKLSQSNKSAAGVSRKKYVPLFSPDGPDAMVLNRAAWEQNKEEVCPVVLDPKLYKCMRPHQREGVQFLYDCTMHVNRGKQGCILADQMYVALAGV